MQISEVRAYEVPLGIALGPYKSARSTVEALKSTLISVHTDEGLIGWGEVCPYGANYLPAMPDGVLVVLKELAPALIGRDPRKLEELNLVMDQVVEQQYYVKTGLDYACWDIFGQSVGMPVHDLLGGRMTDSMELIASVPGSVDGMRHALEHYQAKGYRQYSLHIAAPNFNDMAVYREVVEGFGSDTTVVVDANRSWDLSTAIRVCRFFGDLDIHVEQPCYTLSQCAALRPKIRLPMILDEMIVTTDDVLTAGGQGVADAIALKIGRVGGLTKARRICDIADAMGLPYWIKDVIGAEVATLATAHLAHSRSPKMMRGALSCTDIVDRVTGAASLVSENGEMFVTSDCVGLGFTPDMDVLGPPVATYAASYPQGQYS